VAGVVHDDLVVHRLADFAGQRGGREAGARARDFLQLGDREGGFAGRGGDHARVGIFVAFDAVVAVVSRAAGDDFFGAAGGAADFAAVRVVHRGADRMRARRRVGVGDRAPGTVRVALGRFAGVAVADRLAVDDRLRGGAA